MRVWCALADTDKPTFSVQVDKSQDVESLMTAITQYLRCETAPIFLQFYLTEKKGKWMTKKEVQEKKGDTSGCKALSLSDTKLQFAGLNLDESNEVSDEDKAAGLGPVHVLVKMPPVDSPFSVKRSTCHASDPQPAKKPRMENTELGKLWEYSRLGQAGFPKIEDLSGYLRQPLPFQLQFNDVLTLPSPGLFDEGAPEVKCSELSLLIQCVLAQFVTNESASASEALWVAYYHPLFRIPVRLCQVHGLELSVIRDEADRTYSTNSTLRPDVALHCNGLVLFRGEEKRAGVNINVPIGELTIKMRAWNPMFYEGLPYILGYATSGPIVKFVAIDRHRDVHTILSIASINFQPNEAIKAFYNLSLLFYKMYIASNRVEVARLMPFVPDRNEKRTLTMLDDRIRRSIKFEQCGNEADFNRLIDIYETLQQLNRREKRTTNLQNVLELYAGNDELRVDLAPIGFERKPVDEKEMWELLRDILNALKHWHSCGYCHGDIRWRNVVFVPSDQGKWVLIDMDEARKPNTTIIHWIHPFENHKLCFQHDLFQIGMLMKSVKFVLSEQLLNFQSALMATACAPELTAEAALEMLSNSIALNEEVRSI